MEAYDGNGTGGGRGAIANDDPRGEYTYGEFPFESFDALVDRAIEFLPAVGDNQVNRGTMVDLGSGCGRLVLYAALARGGGAGPSETKGTKTWDVHGVEIGTRLHTLAVNSLGRGGDGGWFTAGGGSEKGDSSIAFHNGNALLVKDPYYSHSTSEDTTNSIQSLLSKTDLLFAYSTVWETDPIQPFDPKLGAMVLAPKWSQTLARLCPNGCVAITTDRALNPKDGWRLADRVDVENPSVWGSVGYVSVLEK